MRMPCAVFSSLFAGALTRAADIPLDKPGEHPAGTIAFAGKPDADASGGVVLGRGKLVTIDWTLYVDGEPAQTRDKPFDFSGPARLVLGPAWGDPAPTAAAYLQRDRSRNGTGLGRQTRIGKMGRGASGVYPEARTRGNDLLYVFGRRQR